MSTIDRVDRFRDCPCGEGKVRVTECSPDHPYARDSQTWYTAEIICDTCKKNYQVNDSKIDGKRYVTLRPNNPGEPMIKLCQIDLFCVGLRT
jgi:hypothetical protein